MSSWASQRFARFLSREDFSGSASSASSFLATSCTVRNLQQGARIQARGLGIPKLARAFCDGASDLAPLARAVGVHAILRSEGCPARHAFFHLRRLLVLVEVEPSLEQHPVGGS